MNTDNLPLNMMVDPEDELRLVVIDPATKEYIEIARFKDKFFMEEILDPPGPSIKIEDLEERISELEDELSDSERDIENLKDEISDLESEKIDLENALGDLENIESERDELLTKIEKLEDELERCGG